MAKLTKKQKAQEGTVDRNRFYPVDEALSIVKKNATSKFDETVEIALNLGVDPRHADQMVRGVVNLPKGSGKTVRVAVFAKGAKAEEATKAVKFSLRSPSEKLALPMPAWMMPAFSTRNSTWPDLASVTALVTSMVTVPSFGLGIRPLGPSTLPSRPTTPIMSGVAMTRS